MNPKDPSFYDTKADILTIDEVNLDDFFLNLALENKEFEGRLFRTKSKIRNRKKFKDPVPDPNESWGSALSRVAKFQPPPLVSQKFKSYKNFGLWSLLRLTWFLIGREK